jgi:hypothetical protein
VTPRALSFAVAAAVSCGSSGDERLPACLRALAEECPHEPACNVDAPESGGTTVCYASGTTENRVQVRSCGKPDNASEAVHRTETRKPDGSLCYVVESRCSCWQACESGTTRWSDGSGRTVMETSTSGERPTYTCAGEEPVACANNYCDFELGPGNCKPGSCPIAD